MKDLPFFVSAILIVIIGFALLMIVSTAFEQVECTQFGQQVEHPVIYRYPSGCYVQMDGGWVPSENYWQYMRYAPAGEGKHDQAR